MAAAAALYSGLGLDDLPTAEVRTAATEALEQLQPFSGAVVGNVLGLGGRDTIEMIASTLLAVADLYDGFLAESIERFESVLDLPGGQYRIWKPFAHGGLALARGLSGSIAEANALARTTVETAEASHVGHHHGLTYAYLALALVAIDRGEPDAATHHLHEAGARAERTRRASFVALHRLLRIEQIAATSGPAAALDELYVTDQPAPAPPLVTDLSRVQTVRFLVATGQLAKARTVLGKGQNSTHTALVVDVELASGRVGDARAALDRWPEGGRDVRTAVERLLRSSAVLVAEGRPAEARTSLQAALDLAEPEGLRRPFLEQPAALRLLRKQALRGSRVFERSIIERASVLEGRATAGTGLADPLTDREREVLDYLPTRLSNQEIASSLYVSVNTLKSHLRHVYTKLDVTDRDACVERASKLGLL